jgi:hypothetical protein
MKSEIITNDKIISVFGDLSRGRMGKEEWILNFENGDASKVMPRGAGQAVRGRRFLHYRPDLILVDDLENDKNIQIYVSIFRNYLKFDKTMLSFILFKYYNSEWWNPKEEDISKIASNIIPLMKV